MTFSKEPFQRRLQTMGDIAERAFEETCQSKYTRYGLNRPPINMGSLSPKIRYTPDYLMSNHLVEVQGLGSDQVFKLKIEKLDALTWWNKAHPVIMFVYDSKNKRTAYIEYKNLKRLCKNADVRSFPEGKEYYAVPAELIWVDG